MGFRCEVFFLLLKALSPSYCPFFPPPARFEPIPHLTHVHPTSPLLPHLRTLHTSTLPIPDIFTSRYVFSFDPLEEKTFRVVEEAFFKENITSIPELKRFISSTAPGLLEKKILSPEVYDCAKRLVNRR
eukprot:TRINITY_DN4097_c0_g1_i6.p1 TRINITY_DN4097_c0_g1~~TRINITY_DN4097_c0_g1_i6.p1  ORF type:complete len:129 (-),score=18.64 TRINITY_DN4097_c0_g1_i6:691-1077(-)